MGKCNGKGAVAVLGIDLAKQSFQLHGVDESGQVVLRKKLSRNKLMAFMVQLPACRVGLEACGGAHHWNRVFTSYGHTVRMMAPQFVKPYVKTNKNDAADAEAILITRAPGVSRNKGNARCVQFTTPVAFTSMCA